MISISAVSYNGGPVAPLAARFDEAGGSIGRAESNRLILPDPDRTTSRLHAEIVHRGGGAFAVVNRGSNPIALNGQALGPGAQAEIAANDELHIGAYVLRVAAAGAAALLPDETVPGGIPADWDPFAIDEPVRAASPSSPPTPRAFIATGGEGSLDALFGLQGAAAADPLAAWGLQAPASPMHADPSPTRPRRAKTDHTAPAGSHLSWNLASGESTITIGAARPAMAHPSSLAEAAVDLSISEPAATVVVASEPEPARAEPRAAASLATPAGRAPGAQSRAEAPQAGGAASSSELDALTLAWSEGLNAQGLPPEALQLTPALLRLLGRLLREATRGTIDLLAARAALKREIRAEVTMIVARENNPLKFSASADVALAHLLGAPERGFMPGDHAMRDAYEDLRAHQYATLAGMRAALEGIFTRFDPATLEAKLTQRSLVDSLLPSSRKARMWDLFNEMYAQIAAEASDDFHELFGKAFLRAYDEQIEQFEKDRQ